MPFDNLSGNHYTYEEMKTVREALVKLDSILQPRIVNLSKEERNKFGSINEKNKLVVNNVKDYHDNEPDLSCDEIDWKEFDLDYADRAFLSATILNMQRMIQAMDNTRILHDYDNFQDALRDYEYTQFKNNGKDPRFETKHDELKQFFAKSSSHPNSDEPSDTGEDTDKDQEA